MIDDYLLELAGDFYVALRARGYLRAYPTFESFLRRAVGAGPAGVPALVPGLRGLATLGPAEPPGTIPAN